jgi:hypothetical protein
MSPLDALRTHWHTACAEALPLEMQSFLVHVPAEHPLNHPVSATELFAAVRDSLPADTNVFVLRDRQLRETWLDEPREVAFQELLELTTETVRGCVWREVLSAAAVQSQLRANAQLEPIAMAQASVLQEPHLPMRLDVLKIPKPWGYEGWYTGVEKRGVVKVVDEQGATELPYALALFPQERLNDCPQPLILLKTLNPVPQPVLGDLYLEMHEEKWEVYVVIDVDTEAWPEGVGEVKAGLRPELVEQYQAEHGAGWWARYRQDFQRAVAAYEVVRRQIDAQLDEERAQRGFGVNEALSPQQMHALLATVPDEQQAQEAELRHLAETFVGRCPVKVGDVVAFPTHQMHALQHGVKVIEFQTPHYERRIVMFGQKVLTQSHWDTDRALEAMRPEVYVPPQPELVGEERGFRCERFVDFPDFVAHRLTLAPQKRVALYTEGAYHLLIGVTGTGFLQVGDEGCGSIEKEEGWLVPAAAEEYILENRGADWLVCLQAVPRRG